MKRVARILALVFVCSVVAAGNDSAKHLFKKAVEAEARQDYETAFVYYKQAFDLKPTELKYRVPFERTRFLAAASKVHRAQKLRDQGDLQEALALFEEAAAIDPSNELAAQEIRRTQQMIEKQSGAGAPAAPPKATEEDTLRKRLQDARAPVMLNEISSSTMSAFESTEDAKVVYETIGKVAGINVLFDPDYQSRRLSVKLKNVTLQEALDIVALESRTFWRPVTPNTIFVAADTQTKRRELEQNVIKTFYLGNVSTPTDLQDIVNAIRTVLEVQRIQQIPSQNAIVIKGTPDQLALAQKMVDDIDKSKPEVIVDVVVAQVRKDKLRDMGIIPPQNAAVALQGTNVTTTPPSTTGGTTTTTTTPSQGLNFNLLQHLNSTNYAVTIDPVTAKLLFSDSASKILQSPRIRATNGEKATLKIADKIPIATGSFGTPLGVGTAVGAVGVNTQFTYTDVGVIMELTPTVHPDGQITLKTSLEISNLNGSQTIGGITQPIISQRKVDHTIRLSDGEVNMLGGILEQTETVSTTGTPFLGSIPFLRYIFSQESKEKITNEIVFLLIPHIVRRQDLDDMNRRAFDVGTGTSIELHPGAKPAARLDNANPPAPQPNAGVPSGPAVPAAPAAQASPPRVIPQPSAPAPQNQPATRQPAPASQSAPASGSSVAPQGSGQLSLRFDPGSVSPSQGSTFALNVVLANGQDISTVSAEIVYDPKVVQFVSATQGDFLGKDGQSVTPPILRDDPASGRVRVSLQRPPGPGVSGDGTVFNLMFMAKAKGTGAFSIGASGARNSQNQPLAVQGSQAAVTVN